MNHNEIKTEYERSIFQNFLNTLYKNDEYRIIIENIHDIRHVDAPDFEVITKSPPEGVIGIELTSYQLDAKQVEKNGKLIIQSDQLITTLKKHKNNEPLETGGFYGIGDELSEIIKAKNDAYERGYKNKSFHEYWLIIHSDNRHPFQFIGNAELPDILLYKCNKAMKDIKHPFQKVFLFCNEKGDEWICQLSENSLLVTKSI